VTIAGIAPHVTLLAVKVLSFLGSGTFEGVIGGNANPDDPDRSQGTWRVEDLVVGACAGRSTVVPQCAVNNDLVAFYVFAAGTSMATPHVSGTAALVQARYGGGLSVDQLVDIITATADDVGPAGPDPYSNYGRINALKATS
jgi:subtilisin family serine protease